MIKAENVNYIYQQGMPFERQALYDVILKLRTVRSLLHLSVIQAAENQRLFSTSTHL